MLRAMEMKTFTEGLSLSRIILCTIYMVKYKNLCYHADENMFLKKLRKVGIICQKTCLVKLSERGERKSENLFKAINVETKVTTPMHEIGIGFLGKLK